MAMDDDFGDEANFLAAAAAVEMSSAPQPGSASSGDGPKVVQPKPQALPSRQGASAILVSTRQKGNPILNHIKSLPWEYSDIVCDYVLGATTCALFLSLKYHRLHPEYVYTRIRVLGKSYNLRILLAMVDIQNHEEALKELSKTSMVNNLTLILCWSAQEAGHYLELFKSYEHASPASIRARQAENYKESLTEFVTTPRTINKTDAASLISNFGSLRAAVNAQPEELALVPGWGEKKVKAWCTTVREPFRVKRAARTNVAVLQHDSAVSAEEIIPDGKSNSHMPIPIISVARKEPTEPDFSREPRRLEDHKLRRTDERQFDEMDDIRAEDEQILEVMTRRDTPVTAITADKPSAPRKEPRLGDGVMAALAKLREQQ